TFGTRSRIPMLWIYAENDHFFGLPLARRFKDAFATAGGNVSFTETKAFGQDGHSLFSARGISIWAPLVDDFLKRQNLVPRTSLIAVVATSVSPPKQLSASG